MNHPARILTAITLLGLFPGCVTVDDGYKNQNGDNTLVQNRGSGKDNWWDKLPRAAWTALESQKRDSADPWFDVYNVKPGVFAIYEPGQFEEVISYLIVGERRAILFDTGLGIGDIRSVVTALTRLPVSVINSHTHYDHIGSNHQFGTILATSTAYTKLRSKGLAHDAVAEFVGEGWIWKKTPATFDSATYAIEGFDIEPVLRDGLQIELGGRTLEVLLTPGHAPDALCLLDRENRLLFTGDTFYQAPLYAHLPGSDIRQYKLSAARLAGLADQVDVLLPAHNEPLVPASKLLALRNAFDAIFSGGAKYLLTDGNREYQFDDFSVIVKPASLAELE